MRFEIEKISPENWATLAQSAHLILFDDNRPPDMDRIDYALIGVEREKDQLYGYITVRELDKESVYWQFGGLLPNLQKSIYGLAVYQQSVRWTLDRYKRITTLIENDNMAYLKLAMKVGFKIIGIRTFKGKILLEHLLEVGG